MPLIKPDLSEVNAAVEPGTYPAEITACEFQTSKSAGNPMIVPTFRIDINGKHKTRKSYLVISGSAAFGFDELLRATGFDAIADQYKSPTGEKPEFNTDDLIGQHLQVVVDADSYNGNVTDKIVHYLKA